MRIARAFGDQSSHWTAGHATGGLDEHLEVESIGITPHDLTYIITRQCSERFNGLS
jgi:hypothetical protein